MGVVSPNAKLSVSGTGSVDLGIGSTNAGGAYLYLDGDSNGDFSGSDYSYIGHDTSGQLLIHQDSPSGSDNILFKTNATERMKIDSTGDVTISDGDLVVASGHGINFAATSDATGMAAELLDDYEEGTWTPTLGGGSSGSFGVQVESATYTKVGRVVTVIASINTTSESSPQGYLTVGGLPFTPASGHVGRSPMLFYMDGMETNYTADIIGLTLGTDTTARAYLGDGNLPQSDLAQAMDASTYVLLTITYNT